MEPNEQNLSFLRNILINTLSPDAKAIKDAEIYVRNIEASPGFVILVLHLITSLLNSNNTQDHAICLAAAVLFKNSIKRCWEPSLQTDDDVKTIQRIVVSDRDTIKTHLIDLMCTAPQDIQRQLAEAVTIISKHDFPSQWEGLLAQLVSKLSTNDISIIKGVMLTANSIMKKFRNVNKSDDLFRELKFCLVNFHSPLLESYRRNQQFIEANSNSAKSLLEILLESRRLMTRIFFSMNWLDLPEEFEDNLPAWMQQFAFSLEYRNNILVDLNEENEPGSIERLQSSIIENLNLYASKYDEEFNPYLAQFTQIIWQLLIQVGIEQKYDVLATNAIKFLSSIASKQRNIGLFSESTLHEIIQHIVVKSVTATDNDLELFEDNPTDYIRKDIEGNDLESRRRCASELVRILLKYFPVPITQLCLNYVKIMLEQYSTRQDWKAKDAAMHLIIAVSVLSSSSTGGAVSLNSNVNIMEIFGAHVLPEIQDTDVNARPLVKADAIKMICIFRSHLQLTFLLDIIPHLIRFLNSRYVVIQTYAAFCIERFLTIKDRVDQNLKSSPQLRITKDHLIPYVQSLFQGLFAVLENPDLPENDYVMKCIMRILSIIGREVAPVSQLLLNKLTMILERICKNPLNPHFNHYLFESLALLIRSLCSTSISTSVTTGISTFNIDINEALNTCNSFEALLFPPFQAVLAQDISEFVPYVFQLLAQLLASRPPNSGLSQLYRALFPAIIHPALWDSKGNVPALIDLLRSYLYIGMNEIVSGNNLTGVLGVFQKLLASKSTEIHAFKLLNSVIEFTSVDVMKPYAQTLFTLCLQRMKDQINENNKTPKYCRFFLVTLSLFMIKYNSPSLVYETFELLTPGLTVMIMLNVVSANLQSCCQNLDKIELQYLIIGLTKLFFETNLAVTALNQGNADLWKAILYYILTLIDATDINKPTIANLASLGGDEDGSLDEDAESREFDTTYSKLAYAQLPSELLHLSNISFISMTGSHDNTIATASSYFIKTLVAFSHSQPAGHCISVIQAVVDSKGGEMLQSLLLANGINF